MNESDRLQEIFSKSLQIRDVEERREYVQQACGTDVKLTQRVLSLLMTAEEAGRFPESPLQKSEQAKLSTQPTVEWSQASWKSEFPFLTAPINSGDLGSMGPYRILQCIGRGGTGIVFRAFDPKLQRVVAIKVLAPEVAIDPMARKRFEREARSAAAVSHPHVVVIHAVDESHNPPYIVMEFIQGKTLAAKIASQGALSVKEILRIGAQIADGLAAAHKQGLVHRDMKPANVLLENGVERTKVADFGLAKAVADVAMTRTGDFSGTPQFMSPEQASGGLVDHRTDLFSLGAILYTMCTGRPPFRADNPLAILKRICEETPRPVERINPEIPHWLSAIVDRLLAKSPSARFQTAAEVATLLEQHLAMLQEGINIGQPALDAKPRPSLNLRRNWPWPMLAFGLLAGIGVLVWLAPKPKQQNPSLPRDNMSDSQQTRIADNRPETGKNELNVLSSEGATKTNPSQNISVEGNERLNAFDGASAGDRRVMTELKIAFRWCPPGRFMMGSPKSEVGNSIDEIQVEVMLPRGFWIQETEVTQLEWVTLMGSLPGHEMNKGKGDRYPIYYVSLDDATKFCRKLTDHERNARGLASGCEFRLPTEEQWEYACRAGTTTATAFGDRLSSGQANFNGDWPHNGAPKGPNFQMAVKVGSYRPNPWGIYDMHGNVKEFTTMPGRVRGGSWYDSGRNCCSAIYIPDPPTALESVGFRMVLVSVP
jgi:serine/threonine protein kinase